MGNNTPESFHPVCDDVDCDEEEMKLRVCELDYSSDFYVMHFSDFRNIFSLPSCRNHSLSLLAHINIVVVHRFANLQAILFRIRNKIAANSLGLFLRFLTYITVISAIQPTEYNSGIM